MDLEKYEGVIKDKRHDLGFLYPGESQVNHMPSPVHKSKGLGKP